MPRWRASSENAELARVRSGVDESNYHSAYQKVSSHCVWPSRGGIPNAVARTGIRLSVWRLCSPAAR